MNLLQQHNAQPQKQPKYTPIFIDRAFTGLYTQRTVLHDPSDIYTSRFYGGRPDALWQGLNIELTNRLTLQRRPGLVTFSSATYPTTPLRSFPFQLTNGTIQVIVDCGSTGSLVIASVANSSGPTAVYTGTFPNGGSNAYVGMIFTIAGFATNAGNNGVFVCTASSTTTLTLMNAVAVAESHAATAVSTGAVYVDNQDGTKTFLFGKSVGAGQTYFLAVAGILYMGDGVDTRKYTPLNTNAVVTTHVDPQPSTISNAVWNWGGAAPVNPPGIQLTASGAAAGTWQASTWFSTMGLIVDPNGNIQQLFKVLNPTPANTIGSAGVIGLSSSGGPAWNQTALGTTTDNTVTWKNLNIVQAWAPRTNVQSETFNYSQAGLCCVYDQVTGCLFVNIASNTTATTGTINPFRAAGYSAANPPPPGTSIPEINSSQRIVWMSLGNINSIPNGYCQGIWRPSEVVLTPPPPVRLIEPFTLPQPGFGLPAAPMYLQENTTSGTTESSYSSITWAATVGAFTFEPVGSDGSQLVWVCQTANGNSGLWASATSYAAWTAPNSVGFGVVVDNNGSLWVAVTSGTSGGSDPFAAAALYWQASHTYVLGQVIIDTNSNRQQVIQGGTSGSPTHPVWGTTQGSTTTDNGVKWQNLGSAYGYGPVADGTSGLTWINVGQQSSWTAAQKFYLPNNGFYAPISVPLGGADINDGVNVEYVVQTGVSGSTVPTWNASSSVGANETVDSTIVWYNNGPFNQNSLTWTTSHTWAYSYKARSTTDYYSVASGSPAQIPAPPPGPPFNGILPAPTGAQSNTITTASPVTTESGANAGAVVQVYGNYSSDPQFDTIVIWRDADGGGSANMFELTEIPNIPAQAGSGKYVINGVKYDWTFQDFLPDTPTNVYPGLNNQVQAPINHVNDPPLSTYLPMAYNFQKVWGASGQNVLFSKGLDTPIVGNGAEAFPPTYQLPFLAAVTRLVRTPVGLITFTVDSVELIGGGPSTASFYSVTLSPGTGLLSFNALDQYAGEIFFFSSDNEFMVMSPSLNVANFGFPLGDQFANIPSSGSSDATWSPATAYVAVHQSGIDNCIFVSNGLTGWYRCNPRQVPGGPQGPEPIWSPFAAITGGAQMVQSVEYTPGIKALLVGSVSGGSSILKRSLTVFTDNGTAYDAYFVMGSIVLTHPGQRALLKFIEADFSGVAFTPTISFLLNEISGSFTAFSASPVADPPSVYGNTTSSTYSPNRYYFSGNGGIAVARHLQIKVDFGTNSTGSELYDLTIYGRLVVES